MWLKSFIHVLNPISCLHYILCVLLLSFMSHTWTIVIWMVLSNYLPQWLLVIETHWMHQYYYRTKLPICIGRIQRTQCYYIGKGTDPIKKEMDLDHFICFLAVGKALAYHGPLTRYENLRVAHASGMPGRFPHHRFQRKSLVRDRSMHHGTCVTHMPWCMLGSDH